MSFVFFRKKKPVEAKKLRTFNPFTTQILGSTVFTVNEWRKIPGLVIEAQKVLDIPHVKAMLAVLRHDAPYNYGIAIRGAQPTEFIYSRGDIDGYLKCLNNLEALAMPLETNEMPEATFEEPEKEE